MKTKEELIEDYALLDHEIKAYKERDSHVYATHIITMVLMQEMYDVQLRLIELGEKIK